MATRRPSPPGTDGTLTDTMGEMLADYKAAKRSGRYQRKRRGVPTSGAGADYHYRNETDFIFMGETARDLARNDGVIGQLLEKAVTNTIGSGFTPDPNTGDKGADKEIKARWNEESLDPDYCDVAGEATFHEQEKMVFRESLTVGDTFALPIVPDPEGGRPAATVEIREFHRCRSPRRTAKNIVLGVELQPSTRKRNGFWFLGENVDPNSQSAIKVSDLNRVEARDEEGEANVFHVYNPKRPTQTRGTTALNPILDYAGMLDDLNFAQLLKAQLAAFFMLVRNRDKSFFENSGEEPLGREDDLDSTLANARPGSQIRSQRGETIMPWSPNIPNQEYFPHVRLILTLIGNALGLPLVMVLMDASETNFSGWRGAVDQARMGFRDNQRMLDRRFHRPYWRMKLHTWADGDLTLAKLREQSERPGSKIDYFRHKWNPATWPYIEPGKDATADVIRDSNMLISPRRRCAERGFEWNDIVRETVADRARAIAHAVKVSKAINQKFGLDGGDIVRWRDLAPLAMPERVSVTMKAGDEPAPAAPAKGEASDATEDA